VYAASPSSPVAAVSSQRGQATSSGLTWLYVLLGVAGIGLLLLGLRRR